MPPLPAGFYKAVGLLVIASLLYVLGVQHGAAGKEREWAAANAAQIAAGAKADVAVADAKVKVVTEYVDRIQVVRERAKVIEKEVKVYVPQDADAGCAIPVGFTRLHDAAASADVQLPTAAGPTDAAASGVALSEVADTVADNYAAYHELAQQLTQLQQFEIERARIYNTPGETH